MKFGHSLGSPYQPPPPRPGWYGGRHGRDPEIVESWRTRRGRVVLDVVLESSGRLSWTVRRASWVWRAEWMTCPVGWRVVDACRAAEAAADLHPANTERWVMREDGVRVLAPDVVPADTDF